MTNQKKGFDRKCGFEGCEKPMRYVGLCNGHYVQQQRGQVLRPLKDGRPKYGPVCTFPDCTLPHYSKGLCNGHYRQKWEGRELSPLEPHDGDQGCSVEGCDRDHMAKGFCKAHYLQNFNGKELAPLEEARCKPKNKFIKDRKPCSTCGQIKHRSEFPKSKTAASGVASHCRSCAVWISMEHRYEITRDDYLALLEYQDGKCGACGVDRCATGARLCIDHDHDCCPGKKSCGECIRGLLCRSCNVWVDRRESPQDMAYLARYAQLEKPLIDIARDAAQESLRAA